jgi:uncharacterized MAPEG superfamily protein
MEVLMSPDLKYLVWSAALCFVQMLIAVAGATQAVGLPKLAGNHDDIPELTGWAGRAKRAHRNMLESVVLFAILVLVAHVTQRANATTALGAMIFFWARLVYAGIYVAGIPWARTAIWGVSVVGLLMIFSQFI